MVTTTKDILPYTQIQPISILNLEIFSRYHKKTFAFVTIKANSNILVIFILSFWSYYNSKKQNSSIPESMTYQDHRFDTSNEILSSFADYFLNSITKNTAPMSFGNRYKIFQIKYEYETITSAYII